MLTKLRSSRSNRVAARPRHHDRSERPNWVVERLEDRCLLSGPGSGYPVVPGHEAFASDAELQSYLIDMAVRQWNYLFDRQIYKVSPNKLDGPVALAADAGNDFTGTNVQVAGVDEADFVKTDGEYAYVVSGNTLAVLDVWPAETTEVVARYELPGDAIAEYLTGDRLTVIANNRWGSPLDTPGDSGDEWDYAGIQVLVFDISDPTSPAVVEATALSGWYLGSRMVDDSLYVMTSASLTLPMPESVNTGDSVTRYETEAEYRERLASVVLDVSLPQIVTRTYSEDGPTDRFSSLHELGSIHRASVGPNNLISFTLFDVADDQGGPLDSVSVFGSSYATIYASRENFYVLSSDYDGGTRILRFDTSATSIGLAAAGSVPGHVLNQFSVDEFGGYLRVATNVTHRANGWWQRQSNSVYVLAERTAGQLEIVGSIENLGAGERIYSVRFLGDRGYVVTFRKTDPLFVIDLSDPMIPQVTGELKIPGFSNYLQPIDGHRLIGIGRGADETTGLFQELQLSLFDVANPEQPILLDRYSFEGWRSGQSEATVDHHAVGYYPESDLLAIPFQQGSWWGGYSSGESNMRLFRINADAGIEQIANIAWDEQIRRTFRINDVLYVVGDTRLESYRMDDYSAPLSTTQFAEPRTTPPWGETIGIAPITWPLPGNVVSIAPIIVTFPGAISPSDAPFADSGVLPAIQPLRWVPTFAARRGADSEGGATQIFAGIGLTLVHAEGTSRFSTTMASDAGSMDSGSAFDAAPDGGDFLDRTMVDTVLSRPRRAGSGAGGAAEESGEPTNDATNTSPNAALDPLFETWGATLADGLDSWLDAFWETTGYEPPNP